MSASPKEMSLPHSEQKRPNPVLKYGLRLFMAWAGFQVWWYTQALVATGAARTMYSPEFIWLLCALSGGLALFIWCVVFDTQIGVSLQLGRSSSRAKIVGFVSMTLIYAVGLAYNYVTDQPAEPFMLALFVGWTPAQSVSFIVLVTLAGPISEELLFRHVVVNAIPWEKSRICAAVITLVGAYIFQGVHTQYVFTSTFVLLFAVAIVLTVARFASGGLLLPYLLHAYCGALSLLGYLFVSDAGT